MAMRPFATLRGTRVVVRPHRMHNIDAACCVWCHA